jgi:outer membrane PBP1 activator LpoA protein
MSAHFAGGDLDATSITLYDTSAQGGAESYRAALRDGADFIVGPLVSDEIPQVLAQAGFVPTLALNVSAGETARVPQFYQFALASDDEVETVAARAVAAGHRTAVVLHASSNFGYNVSSSFRTAFEAYGGQIIASRVYAGDGTGLSGTIEDVLGVAQSEARFSRLNTIVSRPIQEFQPRRRADIDMIFVQIDQPATARLLVPLLEAYTANAIPTYSTRDVYDPTQPSGGVDLDGLIFPDLPLLLQPVGEAQVAAQALAAFNNEYSSQYPREFAFGFDAYKLAEALYARDDADWPLAGATGELHLGSNGRIRRILPIAEFSGGRPRVIASTPGLPGLQ